jgi:hypothetical protein
MSDHDHVAKALKLLDPDTLDAEHADGSVVIEAARVLRSEVLRSQAQPVALAPAPTTDYDRYKVDYALLQLAGEHLEETEQMAESHERVRAAAKALLTTLDEYDFQIVFGTTDDLFRAMQALREALDKEA